MNIEVRFRSKTAVMVREANESACGHLWRKMRRRHYWLLPCFVKRLDPFNRLRRAFCLITIIEIHTLWMGMLVLLAHQSLRLTRKMEMHTLGAGLVCVCTITALPISKAICTLYQASAVRATDPTAVSAGGAEAPAVPPGSPPHTPPLEAEAEPGRRISGQPEDWEPGEGEQFERFLAAVLHARRASSCTSSLRTM